MHNTVLLAPHGNKPVMPAKRDDLEAARAHCKTSLGGTVVPAVYYKGRTIPAGELGTRNV